MSFYLKPPRGQINVHKLEECAKQRITCYDNLSHNAVEVSNFDCLIEDSALDRTGHYLFRLLAYSNYTFRAFFLQNEQKLLLLRLNSYDKKDVRYFLKTLSRQSKDILKQNDGDEDVLEVCVWLFKVCCQLLTKEYSTCMFEESCSENCSDDEPTLKVPFYLCASLISTRDVPLHKGFVIVSCKYWKTLLLSIFNTYLTRVLAVMKYNRNVEMALYDDRIRDVLKLIKNRWFEDDSVTHSETKFDVRKVDAESKFFPLCMLHLYKVLETTNRLSHNDRYDFSLYMKGIGASLSDSLKFWEAAYSKAHASCSKCTHDWQSNEKRYIYGIRHLYGLEGARKNYQVRSCNYLQEKSVSATEDGGCPFKHFDDNNLRKALKKLLPNKEDDIEVMIYERKQNPSEACSLYYKIVCKTVNDVDLDRDVSFKNPVEYYFSLKNGNRK